MGYGNAWRPRHAFCDAHAQRQHTERRTADTSPKIAQWRPPQRDAVRSDAAETLQEPWLPPPPPPAVPAPVIWDQEPPIAYAQPHAIMPADGAAAGSGAGAAALPIAREAAGRRDGLGTLRHPLAVEPKLYRERRVEARLRAEYEAAATGADTSRYRSTHEPLKRFPEPGAHPLGERGMMGWLGGGEYCG
jgi:hypothetical protein